MAVRLQTGRGTVLIIAVYMPVDYGCRVSMENYNVELGYIEGLLESEVYDDIIILGDFNVDLSCKKGRFTKPLEAFLLRCELNVIGLKDNTGNCQQFYTWDNDSFSQKSWIDYFCVSQSLSSAIDEFDVLKDGSVLSDHYPVTFSFNISVEIVNHKPNVNGAGKQLMWQEAKKEDLERYCQSLEFELDSIQIPAEAAVCNDPGLCENRKHLQECYDRLVGAMLVSAKRNLPRRKLSRARKLG